MSERPKPNTLFLSWFFGEYKKGTLVLKPKYQRNPIWSRGQQCFLIDSVVSGCPIPQVYLNIVTKGKGNKRKTFYEVVDGQQRLTSIIEYMNDKWPLISLTRESYPTSTSYKPIIGKKYSDLPEKTQEIIWDYPLAVQELRGWKSSEISALFRRLNYVVETLNAQERRHSQFFGQFAKVVEALANNPFWDDMSFFTRKQSQRMKDIEYVAELFIVVLDGEQDLQGTIDKFYADYDVEFKGRKKAVREFGDVLKVLRTVADVLQDTRFKKKADFYSLFGAALKLIRDRGIKSLAAAADVLREFDAELSEDESDLSGDALRYHGTVIEGANKLPKRKTRTTILYGKLDEAI